MTTELQGTEYAGFRTISKKPRIADIQHLIQEGTQETDQDMRGFYRDFLSLLSKLDHDVIEEAKRRDPEMAKTWMDIFRR